MPILRRGYLLLGLAVLQVLDVITTLAVLSQGGFEGNPLMRELAHGDPLRFLGVKLAAVAVVAWLVLRNPEDPSINRCLLYVVILYSGVVGWNAHLTIGA